MVPLVDKLVMFTPAPIVLPKVNPPVPEVTVKTFEMGSTEPSALLFAAMQAFHNQEAKADARGRRK